MNRDFRRYALIMLLVVSVILLFQLSKSGAMRQQQDRLVAKRPWRGVEPIDIVTVRTKNKQGLETGKAFSEEDDWLDGFTVTVKNTYSKTITAMEINMVFRREPGDTRPPVGQALHFGPSPTTPEYLTRNRNKVIKVGDTAELRLNEYTYKFLKRALEQNGYSSVKRVELVIVEVGFEDGSVFNSGTFYVQDPANPNDPTKKISVPEQGAKNQRIRSPPDRKNVSSNISFLRASFVRPQLSQFSLLINNPIKPDTCYEKLPETIDWCTPGVYTCRKRYQQIDPFSIGDFESETELNPCEQYSVQYEEWYPCGQGEQTTNRWVRCTPDPTPTPTPTPTPPPCLDKGQSGCFLNQECCGGNDPQGLYCSMGSARVANRLAKLEPTVTNSSAIPALLFSSMFLGMDLI